MIRGTSVYDMARLSKTDRSRIDLSARVGPSAQLGEPRQEAEGDDEYRWYLGFGFWHAKSSIACQGYPGYHIRRPQNLPLPTCLQMARTPNEYNIICNGRFRLFFWGFKNVFKVRVVSDVVCDADSKSGLRIFGLSSCRALRKKDTFNTIPPLN